MLDLALVQAATKESSMKQRGRLRICLTACGLAFVAPVGLAYGQASSPVNEALEVISLADQLEGRWQAITIEGEAVPASIRVRVTFNPKGLGAVEAETEGARQRVGFTYAVAGDDTLSVVMEDAGDEPLAFAVRFEADVLVMVEQTGQSVSRLVRKPVLEDTGGV